MFNGNHDNQPISSERIPYHDRELLAAAAHHRAAVLATAFGNEGAAYASGHPDAYQYAAPQQAEVQQYVPPSDEGMQHITGISPVEEAVMEQNAIEPVQEQVPAPQAANTDIAAALQGVYQIHDEMERSDV